MADSALKLDGLDGSVLSVIGCMCFTMVIFVCDRDYKGFKGSDGWMEVRKESGQFSVLEYVLNVAKRR